MRKRLLSILLALCLVTQFVPTTTLAAQAEAVGNTPATADVVDESDLDADQDSVLGEGQDNLADDEAQTPGDQDAESQVDDKANQTPEASASAEVDQDAEADQADVDPQANDSAIAAVSETGDLASEPALASVTDGHIHRICGDSDCTDDSHDEIEWLEWDSSTSLPSGSGNYYLSTDVTLSGTWTCGGDVKLCLNGKTITEASNNDVIDVSGGASLTITDCHDDGAVGKITHAAGQRGRGIYIYEGGALTFWKGSISDNSSENGGGGVYNRGTFTMLGGCITGNYGTNGGGVCTPVGGTFIMSGGRITGNAAELAGGGVCNYCNENIYLSGDVVINNNMADGEVNNVQLFGDEFKIQVTGDGMGENASVGITATLPKRFPAIVSGTRSTKGFFSDDEAYAITTNGSNNGLRLVYASYVKHRHKVCGFDGCEEDHGDNLTWEAWTSTDSLPDTAGNYYLTGNVTLASTWECNANVNLCLNGHDITGPDGGDAIKVNSGASLAITDHRAGNTVGKITHESGKTGRGINNCGTLTLWNGSIAGNSFNDSGGGVCNSGTLNMRAGSITGNEGGGVFNIGTLNLSGNVTISGNTLNGAANNVYLPKGKTIDIAGDGIGENASVGVTVEEPGGRPAVVTGAADTKGFSSDNVKYVILKDGASNVLRLIDLLTITQTHKICGDTACADPGHGEALEWKAVWSLSDITESGNYYLLSDVTLDDTWTCSYDVNLCLNGKTVTGAAGKDVIKINGGVSLSITDCHDSGAAGKITHAEGQQGRGIYNVGTLTLWNGSITGNSVGYESGGGVWNFGTLNIYGGAVSGNSALDGAGVRNTGTFNMSGGNITGNTDADFGGGVYNTGTFNMSGGSIAVNSAKNSAGVDNNGTFTMSGGSITGNSARKSGGGVINFKTLNLSGDVTISGNTENGDTASNVYVWSSYSSAKVVVAGDGLSENSTVGITAARPAGSPVVVCGTTDSKAFFSDNARYMLMADEASNGLRLIDCLTIRQYHKICGEADCADPGHGEALEWKAVWSLSDITESGNYYLLTDVALDDTWTCSYDVNLCLNGKTIVGAAEKETIKVDIGASLAITDCCDDEATGMITHAGGSGGRGIYNEGTLALWNGSIAGNWAWYSNGGGVYNAGMFTMYGGSIAYNSGYFGGGIQSTGTFTLSGGSIAHNRADFYFSGGGGVSIVGGAFNMSGGSIVGNTAAGSVAPFGGGVNVSQSGTFSMSGGSISGNSAKYGGGVYISDSEFNMAGGSVTDNTASEYCGGIFLEKGAFNLSGDVIIGGNTLNGAASNVFLLSGKTIAVAGDGMGENASVGITAQEIGPVVVRGTSSPAGFFSDDENYGVVAADGGGLKLMAHQHKVCGTDGCAEDHGDELTWKSWTSTDSLPDTSGNYYLTSDVTLSSTWKCGADVKLCLNGKTITGPGGKDAIEVEVGASLAITDCHDGEQAGKITHVDGEKGRGIYNGGTLALWGGAIAGNTGDYVPGVGVYNIGSFTMAGGSIAGNSTLLAAAVCNLGGTFTMSGGAITGNTSRYGLGGGVLNAGTLNLSGDAVIKGNTAGGAAGNVYVGYDSESDRTFNVSVAGAMGKSASVGITAQNSGDGPVVVRGTSSLAGFFSDDAGCELVQGDGDELKLSVKSVQIYGVKLLVSDGGDEMASDQAGATSKTYDGKAVAYAGGSYTPGDLTGVTLTYTWQVRSGEGYADIAGNAAPSDAGSYRLLVAAKRDGAVLGTSELPFTIAKRDVAVADVKVAEKTYDGTTAAAFAGAPALEGAVAGDDVALVCGTPTFASAAAGENTPVAFTDFSLSGKDAGNYALAQPAGVTGTISPKELTITGATVAERAYDGTTDAKIAAVNFEGLVEGESLSLGSDYTVSGAEYDGANATGAGAATKATFSVNLTDTAAAKNYVLRSAEGSQGATIKKATISGYAVSDACGPGQKKTCRVCVIDGAQVTVAKVTGDSGILDGELTYAGGFLTYGIGASAAKGRTATVVLKVASANYADYETELTIHVADKEQVSINFEGDEFAYDGTPKAPSASVKDGKVETSDLSVTYYDVSGQKTAAPTKAGTYLMVVSVPDSNATYTGFAVRTFQIKPRELTITGATVAGKAYDGTTDAKITAVSFSGLVGGESLSLGSDYTVSGAAYDSADVANAENVTFSVKLEDTDAAKNYVLKDAKGTQTATISKAAAKSRSFDASGRRGQENACAVPSEYVVSGGRVALSGVSDAYEILDGTPAYADGTLTYRLKASAAEGQAAIVKLKVESDNYEDYEIAVTISATEKDRVAIKISAGEHTYDGGAQAPTDIAVEGEKVAAADLVKTYEGVGCTTYGPSAEAPTAAGSYSVTVSVAGTNPDYCGSASCAFEIKPKELTVTAAAEDKVYDGSRSADASVKLSGIVGADDVTAAVIGASFAEADAGAGKAVTLGFVLLGEDAGNYAAPTSAKATASIAAKELTVKDLAVADKTYDGTTAAAFAGTPALEGAVAGDDVALVNGTPTFASAAAGENTPVAFTDFSLSGKDAGNYALAQPAGVTGTIAAKELIITGSTVAEKAYDGTTDAKVTDVSFSGLVEGESLALGSDYTVVNAKYDGANATGVGAATKATFSVRLSDTAAAKNYVLKSAEGSQAATIRKATLSGYAVSDACKPGQQKTCWVCMIDDAQVTVSGVTGDSGILDGEPTYAGGILTYKLAVGASEGQTATVRLKVASANYDDHEIAVIIDVADKEQVSIYVDDATFTYNGQSQAQTDIKVQDDKVPADTLVKTYVGVAGTSYEESTTPPKAVGTYLMLVSVPDSNAEYTGFAACTFQIKPKELTVKDLAVADKTYDGTTAAAFAGTPALEGAVAGDDVALVNGMPTFASAAAGEGVPVTFTDFSLSGADAGNYALAQPTGVKASIVAYEADGSEYTATTSDWTNRDFVVTAAEGWKVSLTNTANGDWRDSLTCSDEGEGSLTFYVRNDARGYISTAVTLGYKIDKTAPVVSGAQDGRTYCAPVELTAADANLDTVTLNGAVATLADGKLTVSPADGEQVVVATDKAGNVTTLRLTVNDGHAWGAWASNGDGTHSRVCKHDATHTETAACHGGEATCVDRAVCDDCGHPYGEVNPDNHAALVHVVAKEATTEAEGNIEYWRCEACGKCFSDAAGEREVSQADTVIAKKAEDPDGKKDDSDKKDDSQTDDKKDDGSTDGKPADEKADGAEKADNAEANKPELAGKAEPAKAAEANKPNTAGKSNAPETGDAAAAAWLPALLGAAALAAALVSARKRRSK